MDRFILPAMKIPAAGSITDSVMYTAFLLMAYLVRCCMINSILSYFKGQLKYRFAINQAFILPIPHDFS